MKSWEIYHAARKHLKKDLHEVYGNRSSRMIDYWAQDPDFSADPKRNPIDRLQDLLVRFDKCGQRNVALSALRILAGTVDCRVVDRKTAVPDKETLLEEILDDMPCLLEYQKTLQGHDLEAVDRAKAELDREMAENRVKFVEERLRGGAG
jgi:hypothetical protein